VTLTDAVQFIIITILQVGLSVSSPTSGTIHDMEDMDLKQKLSFLKEHKEWKCGDKWERLEEEASSWKTNGLSDLSFTVLETESLHKNALKYTVKL
jgi:hypothetical protein